MDWQFCHSIRFDSALLFSGVHKSTRSRSDLRARQRQRHTRTGQRARVSRHRRLEIGRFEFKTAGSLCSGWPARDAQPGGAGAVQSPVWTSVLPAATNKARHAGQESGTRRKRGAQKLSGNRPRPRPTPSSLVKPRRASPRHATPRHAMPRHSTPHPPRPARFVTFRQGRSVMRPCMGASLCQRER